MTDALDPDDPDAGKKSDPNTIKIVAVGDGAVGKTCLLTCFCENRFPEDYIPTIFDNKETDLMVDKKVYRLHIWDTAGQRDYDRIRPLSYNDADLFLLCYSVEAPDTLDNCEKRWAPEVRQYEADASIILCGTKRDLERCVPETDVQQMVSFLNADDYIECSAKTQDNVREVFDLCVNVVLEKRSTSTGSGKCCSVM